MFFLVVRKIEGDSWFTWRFNHLPGPSISPKRTPMGGGEFQVPMFPFDF